MPGKYRTKTQPAGHFRWLLGASFARGHAMFSCSFFVTFFAFFGQGETPDKNSENPINESVHGYP
jgi:hypothetical protein